MLMVFAVFDLKSACYGNPLFLATRGLALRVFSDACADPKSPMAMHPEDYNLHQLGTFDPNSGVFVSSSPDPIVSAADVIQQINSSRKPMTDRDHLIESSLPPRVLSKE